MNSAVFIRICKNGFSLLLVCLVIGLIVQYADLLANFNASWIDREVRDNGFVGAFYFVGAGTVISAVGAPRQLLAFLGGYAFGFSLGTLLALIATLLGCFIAFYAARVVMQPFLMAKFQKQAVRINSFLGSQPTRKTIVIRLLPVGSNVITNLAAGLTKVKPAPFFTGSLIGYVPQTVVFALFGKGLVIGSGWKILLSASLLLISSYMSFKLYKIYKKERFLKAEKPVSDMSISDQSMLAAGSREGNKKSYD